MVFISKEAEIAIAHFSPSEREVYRKLTAERINTLQLNNPQHTHNTHPEAKTIKSIKTKLKDNEAMIAHTNKGNSLMILPIKQYDSKITVFLRANNFQTTERDPTKTFQFQVRRVVTDSKTLIPQEIKWKYVNMNPTALTIKGLIKMHRPEHPIRPMVNWRGTPAYKLARLFTQKIKQLTPLPNRHNVDNT